jgi:hypothetical protein
MTRGDVFRMIKRRALASGIEVARVPCHTFRAIGIAAHEGPRTTKLYGPTNDMLTLNEIERTAVRLR